MVIIMELFTMWLLALLIPPDRFACANPVARTIPGSITSGTTTINTTIAENNTRFSLLESHNSLTLAEPIFLQLELERYSISLSSELGLSTKSSLRSHEVDFNNDISLESRSASPLPPPILAPLESVMAISLNVSGAIYKFLITTQSATSWVLGPRAICNGKFCRDQNSLEFTKMETAETNNTPLEEANENTKTAAAKNKVVWFSSKLFANIQMESAEISLADWATVQLDTFGRASAVWAPADVLALFTTDTSADTRIERLKNQRRKSKQGDDVSPNRKIHKQKTKLDGMLGLQAGDVGPADGEKRPGFWQVIMDSGWFERKEMSMMTLSDETKEAWKQAAGKKLSSGYVNFGWEIGEVKDGLGIKVKIIESTTDDNKKGEWLTLSTSRQYDINVDKIVVGERNAPAWGVLEENNFIIDIGSQATWLSRKKWEKYSTWLPGKRNGTMCDEDTNAKICFPPPQSQKVEAGSDMSKMFAILPCNAPIKTEFVIAGRSFELSGPKLLRAVQREEAVIWGIPTEGWCVLNIMGWEGEHSILGANFLLDDTIVKFDHEDDNGEGSGVKLHFGKYVLEEID